MKFIDTHCHLDFEVFDHDRDEVIQRANAAGIDRIIIPGVDVKRWPKITSLCRQYNCLFACYGLHPYYVDNHDRTDLDKLTDWLSSHQHLAVGECGLDYRNGQPDKDKQQYYFTAQLDIAQQISKPVVIHAVKATHQVINTLKNYPDITGMIHSYSGSYEQALQLIDMGFYLSFGGAVTYQHATRISDVVKRLPLSALLVETDAPDQPDARHKSERNEPAYLSNIINHISGLRNQPSQYIAQQSSANAELLFTMT